jgi:hypothetical protein
MMEMDDKPTSLEFLQAVYLNETLPLSVRLRAAIEAAPYEHHKLSAMAIAVSEHDFAVKLDRAIERSDRAKLIEGRVMRDER